MYFSTQITVLLALLSHGETFSVGPCQHRTAFSIGGVVRNSNHMHQRTGPLCATVPEIEPEVDDDIQRLKSMAAKLRAEASVLEAKQAEERAEMAERAFRKLDQNGDGEIDLEELKAALEKTFKMDVPEERVDQLMESFDKSGDGKLQKDEFTGMEQIRNKLESLVRKEKEKAREATKAAQEEAEAAKVMEAQMELINDKPPTNTDKIVSVLPYLFPLLDGLAFGRFFLENNENPFVSALAALYTLYRSIPLSGFLAFFGLNVLSGNLSVNRLVRFNMQQAIFLDVALFIPGLVATIAIAASSGLDLQIPASVGEWSSDAVFLALVATIGYSTISSLLGAAPDKVPFISDAVEKRLPSIDDLMENRFDSKNTFKDHQDSDNDKNKD